MSKLLRKKFIGLVRQKWRLVWLRCQRRIQIKRLKRIQKAELKKRKIMERYRRIQSKRETAKLNRTLQRRRRR